MSDQLSIRFIEKLSELSQVHCQLLQIGTQPIKSIEAQQQENTLIFSGLETGNYILVFHYQQAGNYFDSAYFQIDFPDVTLMELRPEPKGCRIEQMGFWNPQGEFVDMLIYEDSKPFLTQSQQDYPHIPALAEFLALHIPQFTPAEAREKLNQLLGPLEQVFGELEHLWPYQLKILMQPAYLAQTTAEWKACLMHCLRNNLILMDDEGLHEQMQEAVEMAQQNERVSGLNEILEWDSDSQSWLNLDQFLKELSSKGMLQS